MENGVKIANKGQITIFVIVGIIIIFAIGTLFFFKNSNTETELESSVINSEEIQEIKMSVKLQFEDCIYSIIDEFVFENGFHTIGLEEYIDQRLPSCTDFNSMIKNDNVKIEKGIFQTSYTKSKDKIVTKILYPISIATENAKTKIEEFTIEYKNRIGIPLVNIETAGAKLKGSFYVVDIAKSTVISGTPTESIELVINNYPEDLYFTVGSVYLTLEPKGVKFDPPLNLTVHYNEEDLIGMPLGEDELNVGYPDGNEWYIYETQQFPDENYVIGKIDMIR